MKSKNILHLAPIICLADSPSSNSEDKNFDLLGVGMSVSNLAESQNKLNNKVGVISVFPSYKSVSDKIYWDSIGDQSLISVLFKSPLQKIVRNFGLPDILNIHDIYNIKQILFSLHFFFRGVKIYVSPRGSFSEGALKRSRIKKKFFIFFYRFYALFIHSFVALNEGEKKSIRKIFKNKKIVVIGNGINFSSRRTDDLNNLFIKKNNNKTINIGFLGRFDIFIKGLDLLLQAYSEYQDDTESPSIRLNLLGAPNQKPKEVDSTEFINDISKNLKNSDLMDVKGPFFGNFKWSELAKLDILILPSRSEGMPNVILEAMSLGIPCAVTKETNMLDLILDSDSGWKIDLSIESIKNFFHEIQELNSKEDLIQKGENGKNYAKKNLTWDIIAKDNYL